MPVENSARTKLYPKIKATMKRIFVYPRIYALMHYLHISRFNTTLDEEFMDLGSPLSHGDGDYFFPVADRDVYRRVNKPIR